MILRELHDRARTPKRLLREQHLFQHWFRKFSHVLDRTCNESDPQRRCNCWGVRVCELLWLGGKEREREYVHCSLTLRYFVLSVVLVLIRTPKKLGKTTTTIIRLIRSAIVQTTLYLCSSAIRIWVVTNWEWVREPWDLEWMKWGTLRTKWPRSFRLIVERVIKAWLLDTISSAGVLTQIRHRGILELGWHNNSWRHVYRSNSPWKLVQATSPITSRKYRPPRTCVSRSSCGEIQRSIPLSLSLQHLKTTYMLERTRYSSTHSETKELTRTRFTLGSETRQFQRIFGSWCGFDRISAMPELVLCLGKNTDLNCLVAGATG